MSDANTDLNLRLEQINPVSIQIWRESLAHLRHLSDEVYKGMKLFLAINGVILVLITANAGLQSGVAIFIFALLGIFITLVARYILKRHRVYYLQMLIKKTLLEQELGFYDVKFEGTQEDLALPWRLTLQTISLIKADTEKWIEAQISGPGTIVRWLFHIYDVLLGFYGLILVGVLIAWVRSW